MSRDEFVKSLVRRGYCSKKAAELYADAHPKEEYSEDDLTEAWRKLNPEYVRNKPVKKTSFDEENWVYKLI